MHIISSLHYLLIVSVLGSWELSLVWTSLCASVLGSIHVCGDHECGLCIQWPRPWLPDLWLRWSPPTAVLFPPLACCTASFGCARAQSAVALLFSIQWDALAVSCECTRWLLPCFYTSFCVSSVLSLVFCEFGCVNGVLVFEKWWLEVMLGWISPPQLPVGAVAMDNIKYVI
jgi:hypothetical protein